jgi:flagellar assembly factor FliW
MSTFKAFTQRFGEVEYTAEDLVTLEGGLLGFESCRQFLLIHHKENSPFRWLQSIEEPGLAFLVTDPNFFAPDYSPEMPNEAAQQLELTAETPMMVLSIVTIPKGKPEEMTLNLAGPIVVNLLNQRARQIVLEDSRYAIKFSPNSTTLTAQPAAA